MIDRPEPGDPPDTRPNWLKAFDYLLTFIVVMVLIAAVVFLIYTKG